MLSKPLKYHDLLISECTAVTKYNGQGKLKQDAQPTIIGYKLSITIFAIESKIDGLRAQQGRFILATNQLDNKALTDEYMLREYNKQHKIKQAFQFIKGNSFEVSSVFINKESRIQSLMMVMALCLIVYSFAELWLHKELQHRKETIPNPFNKPTQQPSMISVCRLFHGIHELHLQFKGNKKDSVINVKDVTKKIISYFGPKAMTIYGLKTRMRPSK